MYKPGDRVVYTASKHSRQPGPRAEQVTPEGPGEGYFYDVRKYWLVRSVDAEVRVPVVTRRGKGRHMSASDERLRPARWWESFFLSSRFPPSGPLSGPDLAAGERAPSGTQSAS